MDSMAQHGLEADQVQSYALYGKACLNWVRSKTRCASSTAEGKCERCNRLNKECQPAPIMRKRRVSKRPVSSTSTKRALLEEKLDGIVQMLQQSQASIPGISQLQEHLQNQSFGSRAFTDQTLASSGASGNTQGNIGCGDFFAANKLSLMTGERLGEIEQRNELTSCSKVGQQGLIHSRFDGPPTPATSSTGNPTVPDGPNPFADYPLESEAELEEYLETYRTKMVPYFLMVCISAETTVDELRKERPFLHLVVRAICSKNLGRQTALVLQVRKVLGREMLIEGAKNLDLFLGVLVFAAWCHFYICNKPIITTAIQLGMSLAFDLGLTRPLSRGPVDIMMHYVAQGCSKPINGMNSVRTMEERRAAIGLYLLSSVSANYFQRIELMRWTPYLDECLRLLEEKKEYPTDDLLVHLVRVQLICNKGAASTWNDIFGDTGTRVPADFYVKALKSQLDDLERSIPLGLKSNVTLQLHVLSTNLSIHEHSLSATPKSTSSDPAAQLQRIENLWICLTTVKSWFNSFFCLEAFPLSCYPHLSMALLTQMAHCLVALYRLSTFESPDVLWDRQRVRQELNLGDVVKLMADRWELVPPAAGIEMGPRRVGDDQSGDSWSQTRKKVLGIGNWWEAKAAAMAAADAERENGLRAEENGAVNGFGGPGHPQMETLEFGAINIDILDDTWMRDLLGGGYDFNMKPYF